MTTEIKNCPFCGNKASIGSVFIENKWDGDHDDLIIECDVCPAIMQTEDTSEGFSYLVDKWNNRKVKGDKDE
jgi:transcription elongation factor Elf1